jgi:Glycosyltransferase family 87
MSDRPRSTTYDAGVRRSVSHLVLMLLVTGVAFGIGAVQKAPCANRAWVERGEGVGVQCYSDIATLRRTEQLLGGRMPYIDRCRPSEDTCDEYPVVSMYVMRASAWIAGDAGDPYTRFFWVNAVILLVCALVTTVYLERMRATTLLFAASPVLVVYGTMNWDLIPVALATAATCSFLSKGRTLPGVLLGIGSAAKVYPALLLIPLSADLWHRRDRAGAVRFVASAAGAWLVVNLPFALAAPDGWWTFFRFNAERPAEYDSIWRVACYAGACTPNGAINILSLALTAAGVAIIWKVRVTRNPDFPRWTMSFPLLALFLVTNKIWSPQYGLWLLPWFALVAPFFAPYVVYQATEVLVFAGRFSFFDRLEHGSGLTYRELTFLLLARTAALLWCVATWVAKTDEPEPAHLAERAGVV